MRSTQLSPIHKPNDSLPSRNMHGLSKLMKTAAMMDNDLS